MSLEKQSKMEKLHLLVTGYVHLEEKKKTTQAVPDGIIDMIYEFYPKLIAFGEFNKQQFAISEDHKTITGIGNCAGYMIYADISLNHNRGYRSGVHRWSVTALPTDHNVNVSRGNHDNTGFSECFQSIGVTTYWNVNASASHWPSRTVCSSYFQGHRGRWKHHEIITVVLNCEKWNVTFYKNLEKLKEENIKPHLSYYFAMACCGGSTWTKVHVVETPNELFFV